MSSAGHALDRERCMDRPDWAPESIDIDRPSAARIYDYWLGGATTLPSTAKWRGSSQRWPRTRRSSCRPTGLSYTGPSAIWLTPEYGSSWTSGRAFPRSAMAECGTASGGGRPSRLRRRRPGSGGPQPTNPGGRRALRRRDPGEPRRPEHILAHPDVRGYSTSIARGTAAARRHALRPRLRTDSCGDLEAIFRCSCARQLLRFVARHCGRHFQACCSTDWSSCSSAHPRPSYPRSRDDIEQLFAGSTWSIPGWCWSPLWRPEPADDVGDRSCICDGLCRRGTQAVTLSGSPVATEAGRDLEQFTRAWATAGVGHLLRADEPSRAWRLPPWIGRAACDCPFGRAVWCCASYEVGSAAGGRRLRRAGDTARTVDVMCDRLLVDLGTAGDDANSAAAPVCSGRWRPDIPPGCSRPHPRRAGGDRGRSARGSK